MEFSAVNDRKLNTGTRTGKLICDCDNKRKDTVPLGCKPAVLYSEPTRGEIY